MEIYFGHDKYIFVKLIAGISLGCSRDIKFLIKKLCKSLLILEKRQDYIYYILEQQALNVQSSESSSDYLIQWILFSSG